MKRETLLKIFDREQRVEVAVFGMRREVTPTVIRFHPRSSFASLWGGSTVPERRRRGLYTALLAVRAQEARRRGYRFLTIDASPMSRPICEKHGFQFLTCAHECVWRAQGHQPDDPLK